MARVVEGEPAAEQRSADQGFGVFLAVEEPFDLQDAGRCPPRAGCGQFLLTECRVLGASFGAPRGPCKVLARAPAAPL